MVTHFVLRVFTRFVYVLVFICTALPRLTALSSLPIPLLNHHHNKHDDEHDEETVTSPHHTTTTPQDNENKEDDDDD
jgi:hypothetical protein